MVVRLAIGLEVDTLPVIQAGIAECLLAADIAARPAAEDFPAGDVPAAAELRIPAVAAATRAVAVAHHIPEVAEAITEGNTTPNNPNSSRGGSHPSRFFLHILIA